MIFYKKHIIIKDLIMRSDVQTVQFQENESDRAIKKIIAITSRRDGASLYFFYKREYENAIRTSISNSGFFPHRHDDNSCLIKVGRISFREKFAVALQALHTANLISESLKKQIFEVFSNGLGDVRPLISMDSEHTLAQTHLIHHEVFHHPSLRYNMFHPRSSSARNFSLLSTAHADPTFHMPEIGPYAEKIADLNISIPDEYKCPLSQCIISDPVYLLGDTTKQPFERSWITTWLITNHTHPITRKSFGVDCIQPHDALKISIDAFMQSLDGSLHLNRK